MAKTVYVVFDTELEKLIGVYDNPEAAEECENAAPGDRYTESMEISKNYSEKEDPRVLDGSDHSDDDDRVRDPYNDDKFYETDEDEDDKDPYGD